MHSSQKHLLKTRIVSAVPSFSPFLPRSVSKVSYAHPPPSCKSKFAQAGKESNPFLCPQINNSLRRKVHDSQPGDKSFDLSSKGKPWGGSDMEKKAPSRPFVSLSPQLFCFVVFFLKETYVFTISSVSCV